MVPDRADAAPREGQNGAGEGGQRYREADSNRRRQADRPEALLSVDEALKVHTTVVDFSQLRKCVHKRILLLSNRRAQLSSTYLLFQSE